MIQANVENAKQYIIYTEKEAGEEEKTRGHNALQANKISKDEEWFNMISRHGGDVHWCNKASRTNNSYSEVGDTIIV